MDIVDIHEAKKHLSRLIEKAAGGETFIIAKAGKPMVKVVPSIQTTPNQGALVSFWVSSKSPMISIGWEANRSISFSKQTIESFNRHASAFMVSNQSRSASDGSP